MVGAIVLKSQPIAPVAGPSAHLLAEAARASAEKRSGGCVRPVRLRGATMLVDTATG